MKFHRVRIPRPVLIVLISTLAATGDATSSSAWSPNGVSVALGPGDRSFAAVTADGAGGCFVLWFQAAGDTGFYSKVYAQHFNSGGAREWGDHGVPVAQQRATQSFASLVRDGQGGILVSFIDGDQNRPFTDIVVQRLNADGGKPWGEDGVVAGSAYVFPPLLVADGSGGGIVVFGDYDVATGTHVLAQHVSAGGELLWPGPGIHVAAGDLQKDAVAATDGVGGAVVAWIQGYPDPVAVAQRLSFDGRRLWGDAGIVLGHQMWDLSIAPDSQGATLLGWLDLRNFTPDHLAEIYVQRLDENGAALWTPGGVAASREDGGKLDVRVAPDGADGAFVTWEQATLRPLEIAAQRIDASGVPLWAPNGIVVSPAGYSEYSHDMAPDGRGGLFVACYRQHTTEGGLLDLFARHLGASGGFDEPSGLDQLSGTAADGVRAASDDKGDVFVGWTSRETTTEAFVVKLHAEPAHGSSARPIRMIEPNPARGIFRAEGVLASDVPAHAQLFDLRGRLVASRLILPAGGVWHASFGEREHLAAGTYVLRVVQGSAVSTGKVSLIH